MNKFRLKDPREQFLAWMDSHHRDYGYLPTSCILSSEDYNKLVFADLYAHVPKDGEVVHLFGVALHPTGN